jgi:PAS domain S-box-containing protein
VIGIVGISFEISERRRADQDRERLAAIVTSTDDAISAWQFDGTVTTWNPGAERLFGYTSDEVTGRANWAIVPPEHVAQVQKVVGRLRGGERIERQLEQTEQRFRSLFTQHPDAVFAMDLNGRYTDLNPACERLSGFPPEELLGRTYGDRDAAPDEARRALAMAIEGSPLMVESALIARDDRRVPVQVTLVPIVVDGSTVGVYGIAKNVSERKHAEDMLALQARQQTAVADLGFLALTDIALEELLSTSVQVVSGVLDVEMAGVLELLPESSSLRLRVGVGFPEGLIGKSTFSADPDSFLGRALERGESVRIDDMVGAGSSDTLVDYLGPMTGLAIRIPGRERHNGVLLACTRTRRAFSDDEQVFLHAIAHVLGAASEREKTADDLRRREHEFKVLVEHAADNIVRMDEDLRLMYVNPATTRLLSIPATELVGRTARSLGLSDAPVSTWERAVRRVFRTGEEDELEIIFPLPEEDRYFHVRLSPEFGPDGSVNSVLGVGRDITVNKQREAERAQIYQELLERDSRLHELIERVLLNQQAAQPSKGRVQNASGAEQFTKRERQILRLLARGLTNREIGQQINLSPSTVKNYIASLLPRLNATDRTQAAVVAVGLGLLEDEATPS